ncbi:D-alanyl-D-alanine carboxypeptidase [Streptomyces sp. NRRL F-5135]|uniref:D-alanyl-D-alanine carboxypeptidase n=1 Tax=Streptomyces sp. NRRL F-5135 TaxID=1463858 RepID=UPI001F47B77B
MNQLQTPKTSRNQDTGRLSFMGSVSPSLSGDRQRGRHRPGTDPVTGPGPAPGPVAAASSASSVRAMSAPVSAPCNFSVVPALKKTALTVTAAALLPLLTATPSVAVSATPTPGPKQPRPPASMSTVGGARLGTAGTQVDLGAGAPVLPKQLSGRAWIVADAESGEVLAAHNAHWRLPPASTLKMLFADTLLPRWPREKEYKVAPADLQGMGEGSSLVGVKENLPYSVHDLWMGVFLRSGNDAVHALAAMNGGVPKTVKEMQAHANELQALDTHVVSPDGYDAEGQVSSAYDLTLIARSGLQKKDFREYCATPSAKFPGEYVKPKKNKKDEKDEKDEKTGTDQADADQQGAGSEQEGAVPRKREMFEIQNTNRLLTGADGVSQYRGIAGVKNGNTTHAGATFTGVAERDGRVLLVTVMNPSSGEAHAVYQESARLLDWGFAAAGKVKPVGTLVPPKSAETNPSSAPTAAGADSAGSTGGQVAAAHNGGSGGMGIALALAGAALIVLSGAVFLVNRRHPLPDMVRRRPRS